MYSHRTVRPFGSCYIFSMPFTVDNRVLPFLFVEVRLVAYFVLCFVAPSSSMRLNKIRFGVTTVSMPLPPSLLSIVVRFCCVQPYIKRICIICGRCVGEQAYEHVWLAKFNYLSVWVLLCVCGGAICISCIPLEVVSIHTVEVVLAHLVAQCSFSSPCLDKQGAEKRF